MNERQPITLYECSRSPADADLIVIAERELGAFIGAVTELFGPEHARLAADEWVDELERMDALPGPADWGSVTLAAAARLAKRLNTGVIPKHRRYLRPIVSARQVWLNSK